MAADDRRLKEVFEAYAVKNTWNNAESKSGPGSTLLYTVNLRSQLRVFVEKFEIRSIFDAPCGDFNWMQAMEFPEGTTYIGGDIANTLVDRNKTKYSGTGREFIEFNVVSDRFPASDVWFCRDCFFHLPFIDIFHALHNFVKSDIKYLMMTNHINSLNFRNGNATIGGFRLLDFFIEPFCLPREILFRIADYVHPHPQREMCVWTREQVSDVMQGMAYRVLTAG